MPLCCSGFNHRKMNQPSMKQPSVNHPSMNRHKIISGTDTQSKTDCDKSGIPTAIRDSGSIPA